MKLTKYLYQVLTIKDMRDMMEFMLWVIFSKVVSQVVIIKKIGIIIVVIVIIAIIIIIIIIIVRLLKKNWCYWKRWDKFSSNVDEVIKSVLNIFFYDKILHKKKSIKIKQGTKKHWKAPKNTTNLRFIKIKFIDIRFIKLKKHLRSKRNFFAYSHKKFSTMEMLFFLKQ